jgi:hypothetical protein
MTSRRVLTWCCVILLAVLSLLPAAEMTRTGLPGEIEHLSLRRVGSDRDGRLRREARCRADHRRFWVYAGILEYLQHISPGQHPAIEDFAASGLAGLCGGLVIALLWRRASIWRR